MRRACSTHKKDEKLFWLDSTKIKKHFQDTSVDGSVTLKSAFKENVWGFASARCVP
jgi:hypothetical protein